MGVPFIVGGHHKPGSIVRTGGAQALLIGVHVVLPELSLRNIVRAEFPVFRRVFNSFQKTFSLFFGGQVKEELEDAGTIAVKVLFKVHNGSISVRPNGVRVD